MFSCDISHLSYEAAMEQLSVTLADPEHISCQIDFDADHSNAKVIRDFVGHIFDLHHIEQPWKGRFVLITDELVNNAIEHGSSAGDIDSCIIEAGNDADGEFGITLEVHDTGTGKDAKDATHMESIRDERLEEHNNRDGMYMEKRGRGLFHITEKLVDKLSFSASPRG
jgi:anti-sigma regulatory factor (Ser/Thr protein kinase)